MKAKDLVSGTQVKGISSTTTKESIYITFKSLWNEARACNKNQSYSKAIDWYEKAFEFGLECQDYIESKEIYEIAFWIFELAYDLPKDDRNYCRPIHIARKILKCLNKDKDSLQRGVYFAWLVVRIFKPIAESLCIEDQQALQILEQEKSRYPDSMNENDYLRN